MVMRSLLVASASLALAACVQTRQYADVEFAPPQGDYDLIVMRPVVQVGSVTAGGLVEPRADWTDQARTHLLAALRDQQQGRGGRTEVLETREGVPGAELPSQGATPYSAARSANRRHRESIPRCPWSSHPHGPGRESA